MLYFGKCNENMGMTDAFDGRYADFSKLGSSEASNIFIKDKAGDPGEVKTVYLDRPFVYLLIDCENNIPFFIGTMNDLGS